MAKGFPKVPGGSKAKAVGKHIKRDVSPRNKGKVGKSRAPKG